jgi:hypothetical protein
MTCFFSELIPKLRILRYFIGLLGWEIGLLRGFYVNRTVHHRKRSYKTFLCLCLYNLQLFLYCPFLLLRWNDWLYTSHFSRLHSTRLTPTSCVTPMQAALQCRSDVFLCPTFFLWEAQVFQTMSSVNLLCILILLTLKFPFFTRNPSHLPPILCQQVLETNYAVKSL